MTAATRSDILAVLRKRHVSCECGDYCGWCAPWACDVSDQVIMDCYLEPHYNRADYNLTASNRPEFYAVLATEEYHRHWDERT